MSSNGIGNLVDIARELGVSPQSVSNWKARDRVPYKYVLEIRNRYGSSDNQSPDTVSQSQEMETGKAPTIIPTAPIFPDREKSFSLSDILLPLAKNLKLILLTPLVFFISALMVLLIVSLFPEKEVDDIDRVYITTAKMIVPGSGGFSSAEGSAVSGIAKMLGLNVSNAGSGASSLTSPAMWPEFLNSRAFAKRMLATKYYTEKYGEEKSLLEMTILMNRERQQRPSLMAKLLGKEPDEIDDMMPDVGLDTLVMQYKGILPGMIGFGSEGSFQLLTVSAFEPRLAVDIAYTVLGELEEFSRYFQNKSLQQRREYIEHRISTVAEELRRAEEDLRIFSETNRAISSLKLQWELERLQRELTHYQGLYTTLKQQLEVVKIDQVQEQSSIIQIVDYPMAPLGPEPPASRIGGRKMILLSALLGLGLGLVITFVKGYFSIVEDDEKNKLNDIKLEAKANFWRLIPFRKGQVSRRNK